MALFLSQFGSADDLLKDQEKLQGEWRVTKMRVQGQDVDVAKLGDGAYIFTKDRLKVTGPEESVAEVTLRPDFKPKELDLKSIEGVGAGKTVFASIVSTAINLFSALAMFDRRSFRVTVTLDCWFSNVPKRRNDSLPRLVLNAGSRTKSCTKVRDLVHLQWRRHLRELGDDWRSST